MGEAELNTIANQLIIHSVFFFYGDAATSELSWKIANDISSHWNEPATLPPADLWLLSDGNYDADNNIQLLNFLLNQLEKGSSLLLTTPGRLTGQAFLTALLPYCRQREQYGEDSPVFAFAFQK